MSGGRTPVGPLNLTLGRDKVKVEPHYATVRRDAAY